MNKNTRLYRSAIVALTLSLLLPLSASAVDEATLTMVINGAAPRYVRLGTQKAAFANYTKEKMYLMLEILR